MSSSDPRFETAAILVRAGKLAADAVERLAPQGGDPALLALQTGLLTRREWKWGEKIRAIEVLSDLLSWEDGRYGSSAAAAPRGGDFRLPVPRLLLELFLRSRDRNLVDHQLGPTRSAARPRRALRGGVPDVRPDGGRGVRRPPDRRALDRGGNRRKAPAEEFAVRKLLAALVTLGLVHPVPAAPSARSFERPAESEEPREGGAVRRPRRSFEESASGPESTVELPMPEEDASGVAPVTFRSRRPAGRFRAEPEMVELPGAKPSPLDRFEPGPIESPWEEAPTPPASERWESPEAEASRDRSSAPEPPAPEPPLRRDRSSGASGSFWRPSSVSFSGGAAVRAQLTAALRAPDRRVRGDVPAARDRRPRRRPRDGRDSRPAPPRSPPRSRRRGLRRRSPWPGLATASSSARRAPLHGGGPAGRAGAGPRATWVQRAERDRKRLEADRKTHYSIQLELVCEVRLPDDAWRHDRGQSMWLLTTPHRGPRLFPGLLGTLPDARSGAEGEARRSRPTSPRPATIPAVVAVP